MYEGANNRFIKCYIFYAFDCRSGVHMSELIYIMSQLEPRFPTLLFAIRSWASARKITNPVPGRQPTNFMFVLLLIYFFQKRQLLPTLDILFNNAGMYSIMICIHAEVMIVIMHNITTKKYLIFYALLHRC